MKVMNGNVYTKVFLQSKCYAFIVTECQIFRDLRLQVDVKSSINIKVTSHFHLPVFEKQLEKFELLKEKKKGRKFRTQTHQG